jgi:hypothetical protein
MKYLKKFNESVIQEYLQGKSFQDIDPRDTWNLLEDLTKEPGPSALDEDEISILEEIILSYLKPELTGAELKYRTIHSVGRSDPKNIMSTVNWKLEYPNERRFDVRVTKFEDDYFFVKVNGVPVSGNTPRKAFEVRYPMRSDDIFLKYEDFFIDGWDGFEDWIQSSPINESNNYDLLKFEQKDYSESRRGILLGRKTNEYRTIMYGYRKIGNDVGWHLFDDKGYHFGTMYNYDSSFKHDGSVDSFGRRKS